MIYTYANNYKKQDKRNEKGEKLYPISISKHQHNLYLVVSLLRNRIEEASEAGDTAAVKRLEERHERAERYAWYLHGSHGAGWFTWAEYQDCWNMINWARTHRMLKCEEHNIPYVE